MDTIIPVERITSKIYLIRGIKVMMDTDLAELYRVETKVLKQAVRRNIDRFPDDFMFELTKGEFDNLRSQFVTSSWGGTRYLPNGIHRARGCDAIECSQQQKGSPGQHSNHEGIHETKANAFNA